MFLKNFIRGCVDRFMNKEHFDNSMKNKDDFMKQYDNSLDKGVFIASSLVSFIITQIILVVLGRFIWNKYFIPSVTFAKPIQSGVQLFCISILIQLLFP
mgnify:CR=1 FL=1